MNANDLQRSLQKAADLQGWCNPKILYSLVQMSQSLQVYMPNMVWIMVCHAGLDRTCLSWHLHWQELFQRHGAVVGSL